MSEDGSEYWTGIIAKLEADRAAVAGREAAAGAEARALALPAATGDAAAAGKLTKANSRRGDLAREAEVLDAAVTGARAKLAAAQGAEAAAAQDARLGRLRNVAADIVAAAAEFDRAASAVGAAYAKYMQALERTRPEGLDSNYYNKLRNRTMTAGGLHLAGVGAVVSLPPVSPHHRKTLEAWATQMLAHLSPQPAAEPVREPAEAVA